jgi:cephalosporin hydroxylase
VEKDMQWIKEIMSDGTPRTILERGNFVASATSQLESAKRTQFIQKMEKTGHSVKTVGESIQSTMHNAVIYDKNGA